MSEEVVEIWKRIKRADNESCFTTYDSSVDSSSFRRQSFKEEETETKFKAPSIEVLLDNTSKFVVSSVDDDSALSHSHDVRYGSVVSDFDEADCGEPFEPQYLVYDFTERPEDKAVTMKCSKFWNYVYSRPELRQYMVYPSVTVPAENSDTLTTEELNSKENEDQNATRPAQVSTKAIKLLAEGKTPSHTFPRMKRCQKYCDSYGSYPEDKDAMESEIAIAGARRSRETLKLQKVGSSIVPLETALRCYTKPQSRRVKAMCKEMASFDEAHPRNLDPPVTVHLPCPVLQKIVN